MSPGGGGPDSFDASGPIGLLTTPLGIFALTTIGGCLLFLMLVRRPLRVEIASGPMLLAHAGAGIPANLPAATTPAPARAAVVARSGPRVPPPSARRFDRPAAPGIERFKVAYVRVRLSSAPDDLRSSELGRLDRGDEVELVSSFEGYLQVRTPTGTTGWIHRDALSSMPGTSDR